MAQKPVSVLVTSASMTSTNKEAPEVILDWVPCIHYLVQFWKDKGATIQALIDFGSKEKAITLAFAKKLGLQTQRTDGGTQKIDKSSLDTFGMVIAGFQVLNK